MPSQISSISFKTGIKLTDCSLLNPADAAVIAATGAQICAVLTDGNVYCWGYNGEGQLGLDTNDDSILGPEWVGWLATGEQ